MEEVKNLVFNYYKSHFDSKQMVRPRLGSEMFIRKMGDSENEVLEAAFTIEEVKNAIWDCDSSSSPGPDGFTFGFFKENWEMVQGDIMKMMDEFHRHGRIVKDMNPTFMVLIPKVSNAASLEDFRPISLIGSAYKIIAKILSKRLAKVLEVVISENQSAFIGGRQILDNILILNESIEEAKRRKKQMVIFKVDFAKAYDSVAWEFLDKMMEGFNFRRKWRAWISECISTATASVLVNGSPSGEFQLHRGLRQGDPLSPFLYLLVAEGLSLMTSIAVEKGILKPIEVGNMQVQISHL